MANHPNRGKIRDWPAHLRAFRLKHGLSQAVLAKLLRCGLRTVQNWEGSERTPPQFLKLALAHIAAKLQRESEVQHAPAERER